MAICSSCGNDTGGLPFCTRCGAAQTPDAARGPRPAAAAGASKASSTRWVLAVVGVGVVLVVSLMAVAMGVVMSRLEQAEASRTRITEAEVAEVGSSEAWPTLRRIQLLQQQHRERHGTFTRNLTDPSAPDALQGYVEPREGFFRFWVPTADRERLCIEARPTERGTRAGLAVSSMDEKGSHFLGAGCRGTVLNHEAPGGPEDFTSQGRE